MTPRPDTAVREIEHAAETGSKAAGLIPAALKRLSDASPGFPGGHVGGSSGPDGDVHLTQPERFTQTMGDSAVKDLAKLTKAIRAYRHAADDLWGIASTWGVRRDARDLEVADPEDDMWCRSCLTIGHMSPRRIQGGVNCGWCYTTLKALNDARADAGRKPMTELPKQAISAHARGDRVYLKDLERWAGVGDIRLERADSRKRRVLASPDREEVAFQHSERRAPLVWVTCTQCPAVGGELARFDVPAGLDPQVWLDRHRISEHSA